MNSVLGTSTISITLPEMGESVTEGSIVEWRRKPGEFVAEGDPLVEVTTDKVDVEVPATASGVLTQILAMKATPSRSAPFSPRSTPRKKKVRPLLRLRRGTARRKPRHQNRKRRSRPRRGAASRLPTIRPNVQPSGSTSILRVCAARVPTGSSYARTCWLQPRPRVAVRRPRLRCRLLRYRRERR